MEVKRLLSQEEKHPFEMFEWERENIQIIDKEGTIIYECPQAEFPKQWSWIARQMVASKYFRESRIGTEKETSVKTMAARVVNAICDYGIAQNYFDEKTAKIFNDELLTIFIGQYASLNSPVWFNVGVPGVEKPTGSACFINEVKDDMRSILNLAMTEGLIFKEGSGSGVNFSPLRGSNEVIRGGGHASGPVSFLQGYDAFANVILSGGRTRRAARMCILNADHPDIEAFINLKAEQEDIAALLILAGLSADFRDKRGAYAVVKHQSGNYSVRVTDAFMKKVREVMYFQKDSEWPLINRTDGSVYKTVSVQYLFNLIAQAAHKCGDPGIQFHDTINRYHTCANDGEIVGSNPCSEFVFLNNSACNLASVNLCKFIEDHLIFDIKTFKHVTRLLVIAQDILVEACGYPTPEIERNSHKYRPLGLGFCNLGGLLMSWGLPYDSTEGRQLASAITSLMTGQAYATSAELAAELGPFEGYENNKTPMEEVLLRQYKLTRELQRDPANIVTKAVSAWQEVKRKHADGTGYRNAQVTLLAPTGTIAFMMDAATTGIEPDIALTKTKLLVGGSSVTYSNPNVLKALSSLGYNDTQISSLEAYLKKHGHLEGSELKPEHLSIFDCAIPAHKGTRCISVDGHLDMVAAVQPFLSGAISKTFNMPHDTTVREIERAYLKAWEAGIKCVAIYREGSKMSEPLRVKELKEETTKKNVLKRKDLPADLKSFRHRFSIGGHKGYFHGGLDPDTKEPIELFIKMAKFGSTVGGLLDSYGILFSKILQYGVPLEVAIEHMVGSKFPPAGVTDNPDINMAKSIMDYIARYLSLKFLGKEIAVEDSNSIMPYGDDIDLNEDMCPECGSLLHRTGTCTQCNNCGFSSGICG